MSGRNIRGEKVAAPWLDRGTAVLADYRAILGQEPVLSWAREMLDRRGSALFMATGQDFSRHLEITVSGGRNYREHVFRAPTLETWLRRHWSVTPTPVASATVSRPQMAGQSTKRAEGSAVTTAWDLLEGCVPNDYAEQVPHTHFLDEVMAGDPTGAVLLLGADESAAASLRRRHPRADLTHVRVGPPWQVSSPQDANTVRYGDPLPAPSGSRPLIACFGLLEEVDDPTWLASEIARVLAPDGLLVGSAAYVEPAQGLAQRRFTPVGLRLLLEENGLHVAAVRPGTDGVAMTLYWLHGQSDEYRPYLEETSPLNAEIDEWGRLTGRRPALVNNRKLQHCGRFAFSARREEVAGPTAWMQALTATGSPPKAPVRPRSSRRPSFREFDARLPRPPAAAGTTPRAGDRLAVQAPMGQFIPRELQRLGLAGYEPESLACYLAAASVAGDGWMWDVGANVGLYGLLAAAMTTRDVVAFEPTPALTRTLRSIARSNRLPVTVEELALSDHEGTATFYLSDRTDASNSLAEGFRQASVSIDVPLDTVDSFVERTGQDPAVMKIDTETTEPDVLRGAEQTILRRRPWILCEVLPGRNEQIIGDMMTTWGYRLFHVDHRAILEQRDHVAADHGELRNWLFAPVEPGADFWDAFQAWKSAISECGPT